jgi:hypothetical protein
MSSHHDTYNYKCLYVAPTFHGCLVEGFAPARYSAVQNHKKMVLPVQQVRTPPCFS